jgi:hypothetical protein
VWGYVRRGDSIEAVYYLSWTLGQVPRHGAHLDLIIGRWGEETTGKDRIGISLEYRLTERGPEFMVIDASSRKKQFGELAAQLRCREEVIRTPLARRVFDIVDAVWLLDDRINEITARH